MKLKIVIAVLIVVALVLAGLGLREHRNYQKRQDGRVAAAVENANKEQKERIKQLDEMTTKYNALYEQCNLGLASWKLLPAATQVKNKVPNCGLPITQ